MICRKELVIKELDVLRRLAPTEEAGVFKVRQYTAAIKTLRALPALRTMSDLPTATKGDGLGTQIRKKIEHILTTGSGLNISDKARTKADALACFSAIYGVGPKKAEELVAAGFTTIVELRAAVTKTPGILNRNQHLGLKYYEDILERIPRAEMDVHAAALMAAKPMALKGVIVGSYRRGNSDSGDIDMLLTCPSGTDTGTFLNDMVTRLRDTGYLLEILAQGEHKCLAIVALPHGKARRLDLLVISPDEFPFAVLYFTGSDAFNVRMRQMALERGFTLNEHALTQVSTGRKVKGIKTEEDIFVALKCVWCPPEGRTGADACKSINAFP